MKKLVLFLLVSSLALAQGGIHNGIALKSTGVPASGASVRVCTSTATGTPCSPLASIYSDAALANAIVGSVTTADANGNYSYYTPAGFYKEQVTVGSSTFTSIVQVSETPDYQMIDVRNYGAIGNGVTDDYAAIQTAINAGISTGKCVFIPSGTWLINTGLIGNSTSTAACIQGAAAFGSGASILKYGGSATALTISNSGSYVYNAKLSNFAILATQNATSGIICDTCSEFIFDTVGVVGKSDLTGKFTAAFDLRGSHTPSSNIAHITNSLCQYNTSCFKLMDVSGIDIFGGDFYQNTQVFLMGSADHVHIHGIMNAEQQDYFINWDDSLTPAGTILADNVNIEDNNVVFDGSFGTHNYFLKVSNTGTNRFNLYNSLIQGNRIFCAIGVCATDYPFHFAISGSTNVNTLLTPVIKNNWLNGAATGGVTSNSATVVGQFSENQNYGVSGVLNVDVAGTVSSWLCMNNNRSDQAFNLGCNNRTAGVFASYYNAGDGATNVVIRESGSQGTVAPFTINDSSNNVMAGIDYTGKFFSVGGSFFNTPAGTVVASINTGGLGTFNGGVAPSSTADAITWFKKATHATLDLASVASAACTASQSETITGSLLGDVCKVSSAIATADGSFYACNVTATDTVKWSYCNLSGSPIDRASDTYTIRVTR